MQAWQRLETSTPAAECLRLIWLLTVELVQKLQSKPQIFLTAHDHIRVHNAAYSHQMLLSAHWRGLVSLDMNAAAAESLAMAAQSFLANKRLILQQRTACLATLCKVRCWLQGLVKTQCFQHVVSTMVTARHSHCLIQCVTPHRRGQGSGKQLVCTDASPAAAVHCVPGPAGKLARTLHAHAACPCTHSRVLHRPTRGMCP